MSLGLTLGKLFRWHLGYTVPNKHQAEVVRLLGSFALNSWRNVLSQEVCVNDGGVP